MKTIRMNKHDLAIILRKNRDTHAEDFRKASSEFMSVIVMDIDDTKSNILRIENESVDGNDAKLLESCRKINKYLYKLTTLPVPEHHLEDYDRVIKMLDHSVDDIVELDELEYRRYVQDEWSWANSFAANTKSYSS